MTHGLTARLFLMKWFRLSVLQFEGIWNLRNCGRFVLEVKPIPGGGKRAPRRVREDYLLPRRAQGGSAAINDTVLYDQRGGGRRAWRVARVRGVPPVAASARGEC